MRIVLDPGHGRDQKGAWKRPLMTHSSGATYREDTGTLEIAKLLREKLFERGYEVHMTREDERSAKLFLEEKYKAPLWKRKIWSVTKWIRWFTKAIDADVFISIHTNAGKGKGPACFWWNKKSEKLSKFLCEAISNKFKIPIRTVKKKGFLIIKGNTKSGLEVLLECLFHDDNEDLGNLIFRKEDLTDAIVEGLENFLSSKP